MGMTMTIISNNLNTGNVQKNNTASSNPTHPGDSTFSSILAMQAATPAQKKPASAAQSPAENSQTAHQANGKAASSQSQSTSGKAENRHTTTDSKISTNDEVAQTDSFADKAYTTTDAHEPTASDNTLNAGQIANETLQANLLAEQAMLQQGALGAGINTGSTGKPAVENTLLNQLIEPQRNLSSRLSGKNQASSEGNEKTVSGLTPFSKNIPVNSGLTKPDSLLNTEHGKLTASQLAALDKQTATGQAVKLNANKKAGNQIQDTLFGRLPQDTNTSNPADPRLINLKASAQLQANQTMAAEQTSSTPLESSVSTTATAAASASVTNTQAQAPASPLIALGTSFYHPGWSQAMAQQVATQASLFFRQQANGTHIAQMRLDPPELGPIKVSISIQDGVAQAAFVASNATVRQALENAMADLHQALQEKGLSLGQAHVEQQDQQGRFFMDEQNASGRPGQTEDTIGGLTDISEPADKPSRQHDGLISTFA